jgi:hypothetical protein
MVLPYDDDGCNYCVFPIAIDFEMSEFGSKKS